MSELGKLEGVRLAKKGDSWSEIITALLAIDKGDGGGTGIISDHNG